MNCCGNGSRCWVLVCNVVNVNMVLCLQGVTGQKTRQQEKAIIWCKSRNLLLFKTCVLSQKQTVVPGRSSKEKTYRGYLCSVSEQRKLLPLALLMMV